MPVGGLRDRIERGDRLLWIDYVDYASRLLEPGGVPWTDTAGTVAWYRRAQGLLSSDVVPIPLWPIATRVVTAVPGVLEQMRAKTRVTHALRALLSSDGLRSTSGGLVRSLRVVFPQALLALSVPTPRDAIALAHGAAATAGAPDSPEIGEDEVDAAAPYLADFLRGFGDAGLDLLLLESTHTVDPDDLQACRPMLNTARHYGWEVGLRAPGSRLASLPDGFDFFVGQAAGPVAAELESRSVRVARVGEGAEATFYFAQVSSEASPERVLAALAQARSGAGR
jgi:hypothetical protein